MPRFETIPLPEAKARTASRRTAQYISEYIGYIQQLSRDQAGMLVATEEENILTIRRRLKTAADMLGKKLTIKRAGEELHFWVEPVLEERPRRRGGRRRGSTGEGETATGEAPGSP